jgi:hypothetical protein
MLTPCRNLNELFLSHKFAEDPENLPVVPHQYLLRPSERNYLFDYLGLQIDDYVGLLKYFSKYPEETITLLDQIIPSTKIIKILDHQMITSNVDFLFSRTNTKFVLLNRTNKLEQFVSHETAKKSGEWVNTDTSNIKVHVDQETFFKFKTESDNWYNQIRKQLSDAGHNFLEINYEHDLNCKSLSPVMFKIKDWLLSQGVETTIGPIKIMYKKQNTLPMSEKISNFDEINKLIK